MSESCEMAGSLTDRLRGKRCIHVDTATLIYLIEGSSRYRSIVRPLFELVAAGGIRAISSFVTLLEVLVKPIADGQADLARQYRQILLESGDFTLFPLDEAVAEKGAELCAKYSLEAPDGIQLATARVHGADAFITNDRDFKHFDQLEVIFLDDFLSEEPLSPGGS